MPTTTHGTEYTITSFTPAGATHDARLITPDALDGAQGIPLMFYFHGRSDTDGDELSHANLVDIRNAFLDAGFALLEADADGTSWGNDDSRDEYQKAFVDARSRISVGPVVCFGRSMGGITGSYAATQDPIISPHVVGLILNSPVQSLTWAYENNGTWETEIETAYGFSGSEDFAAATAGHDPLRDFDADVYDGLWVAWFAGSDDTLVPPDDHTVPMHAKVSKAAKRTNLTIVDGADHTYPGTYTQHAESVAVAEQMMSPFLLLGRPTRQSEMRVATGGELRSVKVVKQRVGGVETVLGRSRWLNPEPPTWQELATYWWDAQAAASISTSGSDVTEWEDQVAGVSLVGGSGTRPELTTAINGESAITFNGSTDYLETSNLSIQTVRTVVAVYKPDRSGVAEMWLQHNEYSTDPYSIRLAHAGGTPLQFISDIKNNGATSASNRNSAQWNAAYTEDAPTIVVSVYAGGTTQTLRMNGVDQGAKDAGSYAATLDESHVGPLILGASHDGSSYVYHSDIDVGELIVFNDQALSTSMIQAIEAYLAARWSITL